MGPFPLVVRGGLASAARVEWQNILWPSGWHHRIDARGGFISADFALLGPRITLFDWFENGLGRYLQRFDDAGLILWEGIVWSLTLSQPGIQYTQTLENLSNRTYAQFSITDFSGDVPVSGETKLSTAAEDIDSQNRYGIFESLFNSSAQTEVSAEADRDNHHNLYRRPSREARDLSRGDLRLSVECRGVSEMYKHRSYTDPNGTDVVFAHTLIADVNTQVGQFVARTKIDTNTAAAAQTGKYYSDVDLEWAWDILNMVADKGDGTDRWTWGVWEDRELRYYELAQEVDYLRNFSDPYRRIQTFQDRQIVPPWRLRPGKFIQQPDAFPLALARNASFTLDPTIQFIQAVEWSEDDLYNYSLEYLEGESLKNYLAGTMAEGVRL